MWLDPACNYATIPCTSTASAALAAGQYVETFEGEYIHLTLGDDKVDQKMMCAIDAHLQKKWPKNIGDNPDLGHRMCAAKELGADATTAKVSAQVGKTRLLQAEPEQANVQEWLQTAEQAVTEGMPDMKDATPPKAHSTPNPPKEGDKKIGAQPPPHEIPCEDEGMGGDEKPQGSLRWCTTKPSPSKMGDAAKKSQGSWRPLVTLLWICCSYQPGPLQGFPGPRYLTTRPPRRPHSRAKRRWNIHRKHHKRRTGWGTQESWL